MAVIRMSTDPKLSDENNLLGGATPLALNIDLYSVRNCLNVTLSLWISDSVDSNSITYPYICITAIQCCCMHFRTSIHTTPRITDNK